MRPPTEPVNQRIFSRRALLLAGSKLILFSALGIRLHYLQVVEANRYRTLSEENQFNFEILPPVRGRIFDRNGTVLADNKDNFRIEIVSEQTKDIGKTLLLLKRLVNVENWDMQRVLRDIERKRGFVPVTVLEDLSRNDISKVAINMSYLPGIKIEVGQSRYYPFGDKAVHLTGYVAAVSETELTGDPVLELPGFQIGKSGAERFYDLKMRGKPGQRQVEVNALGRIIRKLPGSEGKSGKDVSISIDIRLQKYVTERLARGRCNALSVDDPRIRSLLGRGQRLPQGISPINGIVNVTENNKLAPPESGAAVVMDIYKGDVLAMASTPGFDPNVFTDGLSPRDWEQLLSNPRSPMTNKAISGQYAPGSTLKMIVCLAALEAGIASSSTKVFCPGYRDLGSSRFHCWRKYGHGQLDMIGAIEQSCDVYMYEMASRLGVERIGRMARRFGLGEKLGLELPGERPGFIPTRAWKRAALGESWQKGETLITSIGQGFLLCTPIQLVTMMARLVNGGQAVIPQLSNNPASKSARFEAMQLNPQHLSVVIKGMDRVINGELGTARKVYRQKDMHLLGGKSGSVQVKRISRLERLKGKVKNEDRPWKDRDHAMFVAFAPLNAPKYATAVVVEHGGGGSSMAGPIARDVLLETMRLDPTSGGRDLPRNRIWK